MKAYESKDELKGEIRKAYGKFIVEFDGIPFELKTDPFYSEKNMERLRKAKAQIDAGLGIEHELLND